MRVNSDAVGFGINGEICAKGPEHPFTVIRERAGSVTVVCPSAKRPANNTQDFTWADAMGEW